MTVRVELNMLDACKSRCDDAMTQFLVRQALRDAGIPMGPWGSSTPERGTLSWWDDPVRDVRVIEWKDEGPK
jgi:hypothetical protein